MIILLVVKKSLFGLYTAFAMTASFCDAVPVRAQGLAGEYQVKKQASWGNVQFHNGDYGNGEKAFYAVSNGDIYSVSRDNSQRRVGSTTR